MSKNDLLFYNNYYGSIHFNAEEMIFFGQIEFIRDLVNYEATDAKTLVTAFNEAVDSYLVDCAQIGRSPDKPFKGSFNVRVEPELHKEISLYAISHGETLNSIVKKALNNLIKPSSLG
jgi:predicted HicB family RNase H-like nuclease